MPSESFYSRVKLFIERPLAALFLIFSLPLILVIYILIKLDSPGKAIFTQARVGKDRKPFAFYKFRTMCADAKKRFPELYRCKFSKKEIKTMRFKLLEDPRLTRFGKKLRRTSLDELPNLINVIRGEMSLIGPRPEIPQMMKYYKKNQLAKFSVKPGITGLSQVNGRGFLTFQQTIAYDLEYVKNKNLLIDLKIILKTLLVVLKGLGAF